MQVARGSTNDDVTPRPPRALFPRKVVWDLIECVAYLHCSQGHRAREPSYRPGHLLGNYCYCEDEDEGLSWKMRVEALDGA